jgi:hypothetical protein
MPSSSGRKVDSGLALRQTSPVRRKHLRGPHRRPPMRRILSQLRRSVKPALILGAGVRWPIRLRPQRLDLWSE